MLFSWLECKISHTARTWLVIWSNSAQAQGTTTSSGDQKPLADTELHEPSMARVGFEPSSKALRTKMSISPGLWWCLQARWARSWRCDRSLAVLPHCLKWGQTSRNRFILSGGEKWQTCIRFNCCFLLKGFKLSPLACHEKQLGSTRPGRTSLPWGWKVGKGDTSCHLHFWLGKPQPILHQRRAEHVAVRERERRVAKLGFL